MSLIRSASATFASKLRSSEARIQLMSAPPQKTLPSPASTTARTSSAAAMRRENLVQLADHLGVEGVADLGARQRDAGDAVG